MDYKKAYFELQGELDSLIEHIKEIQQRYEERYISSEEEEENK